MSQGAARAVCTALCMGGALCGGYSELVWAQSLSWRVPGPGKTEPAQAILPCSE